MHFIMRTNFVNMIYYQLMYLYFGIRIFPEIIIFLKDFIIYILKVQNFL